MIGKILNMGSDKSDKKKKYTVSTSMSILSIIDLFCIFDPKVA